MSLRMQEHVEDHRDWLKQNALAYLNVDTAVSGPYFRADATPSLSTIIQHVAQRIMDPRTGGTVFDQWHDYDGAKVGELGSGSDFIGFVDHVGVASVNFHFSGPYGVYHSNYDSFHWMETQGDPGFHYHTAATQFWGMLALELADAPSLLPLNYTDYANQLVSYVHRSEKTISEGLGMEVHLLELRSAARDIEIAYNQLTEQCSNVRPMWPRDSCNITMINDRLMRAERAFMDSEGMAIE